MPNLWGHLEVEATPRVNLNNGQFEFPIFKTWKFKIEELEEGQLDFPIHPQNQNLNLKEGQLE